MSCPDRSKDQTLGRETRAIIEAINGLKKSAHENLNYMTITLDLTAARVNEVFPLPGWFDHLTIAELTGSVSIRLNEPTKDLIDLTLIKRINSPIRRIYVTHDAQPGATLTALIGGEAHFETDPIRGGETIFTVAVHDEAGGDGTFQASYAKADTPVVQFQLWHRNPRFFRKGIALRVHYRLNPTNAVTYTVRIYRGAFANDYDSNRALLYESAAARVDDTDYDIEIEKPFILYAPGIFYLALEWTGAPGVTSGFVELSGIVKQ